MLPYNSTTGVSKARAFRARQAPNEWTDSHGDLGSNPIDQEDVESLFTSVSQVTGSKTSESTLQTVRIVQSFDLVNTRQRTQGSGQGEDNGALQTVRCVANSQVPCAGFFVIGYILVELLER